MDRVCHFEIPYEDKARMQQFYSSVFGWNFNDAPGPYPYSFVFTTEVNEQFEPKRPGGINGGAYQRGEGGGSKTPVVVIEVPSCEGRIQEVLAAGGRVILPLHAVGNMGIYAQVADTEGNVIGLWQPTPHAPQS